MDLKQHLLRQMAFSHATFGPGKRTDGVLDHLTKEIEEVRNAGDGERAKEWVDLVILAFDGLTRELAFGRGEIELPGIQMPTGIGEMPLKLEFGQSGRRDPDNAARLACILIVEKQTKNEGRTWPDWRTVDPNKAIEHDRDSEKEIAQ